MRKLTVIRRKTFTMAHRFYVAVGDENGTLKINGARCRILGRLANGGEASFEIPEDETRVYVFESKHSREYTYDMFTVPAGSEDVVLEGQSYINPATGSSFLFDGNDTPETGERRSKNAKKAVKSLVRFQVLGVVTGVLIIVLVAVIASVALRAKPRTFTIKGASITLTDDFSLKEDLSTEYLDYLVSKRAICLFLKADENKIRTYDQAVKELASGKEVKNLKHGTEDGLRYFTYNFYDEAGGNLLAMYFVYDFKDGIYVAAFMTPETGAEKMTPSFIKWAKTAKANPS